MGTTFSEILTAAMRIIDDVRWRNELAQNPALFYRAKSELIPFALPLLSRPPELTAYLANRVESEARYDDAEWTSTADSTTQETVVETGKTGFELCCVSVVCGTCAVPYKAARYDAATGNVTFPVQEREGITYQIDFYSDGAFSEPLSLPVVRLFALAIAVVWDERLDTNWLADTMKIKNNSFETANESNYMAKTGEKRFRNRQAFNDELRKYEQDGEYFSVVAGDRRTMH